MVVTDQMQRSITLNSNPKRIISLVPSQTELLADLGLDSEVVGITKFCIHPNRWFREKPRIGGTKNVKHEVIESLNPDLIIANKEENSREDIAKLSEQYPVWISDIKDLDSALTMIESVGEICDRIPQAKRISDEINTSFEALANSELNQKRVAYLIWNKPYMAAGHDTFINHMLGICGFENAVSPTMRRYPKLDMDWWESVELDYVLLSSEPFPFKAKHIEDIKKLVPSARVEIVDGEAFSWYGSRLIKSPEYFRQLIYDLSRTTSD